MSVAGSPCGPPGMQKPECGSSPVMQSPPSATSYVVNSKIMVVAVAVLFAVVVFILCLHVYAKWYWRTQAVAHQQQQQQVEPGSWRRGRAVVVVQSTTMTSSDVGLEKAVIDSLPTFEFRGKHLECAVCLEDFEAGEKGRTLPQCGHHFHLDCVDMWLFSHSTCPLCRASAHPDHQDPKPADSVPIDVDQLVQTPFVAAMRDSRRQRRERSRSSESTSDPTPEEEEPKALNDDEPSASSIRAPFQVSIDVPPRADGPGSVMSPMARASASFRRLLSRGSSVLSPHHDEDHGSRSSSPRMHSSITTTTGNVQGAPSNERI